MAFLIHRNLPAKVPRACQNEHRESTRFGKRLDLKRILAARANGSRPERHPIKVGNPLITPQLRPNLNDNQRAEINGESSVGLGSVIGRWFYGESLRKSEVRQASALSERGANFRIRCGRREDGQGWKAIPPNGAFLALWGLFADHAHGANRGRCAGSDAGTALCGDEDGRHAIGYGLLKTGSRQYGTSNSRMKTIRLFSFLGSAFTWQGGRFSGWLDRRRECPGRGCRHRPGRKHEGHR